MDSDRLSEKKRLLEYQTILEQQPSLWKALEKTRIYMPSLTFQDQLYLHIFAPTLVAFVSWVLETAQKTGKKRLYFLARDGYPLYLVAKKICSSQGFNIECRYLKVSRYSLRTAEYHLLGENCLDYICSGGMDVTIEKIMKRAALTDEEGRQVIEVLGRSSHLATRLAYPEILKLKEELKKLPLFMELVREHSKKRYPSAIGYLMQEGLFENIPYGIVDSGWIGTIQKSMESLICSADVTQKPVETEGYYFGLYELPQGVRKERYHSFYFEPGRQIRRKAHFSNCLFEAVCSAPEGMTLGYCYRDTAYEPLESSRENPNKVQLSYNLELLLRYTDCFLSLPEQNISKEVPVMIERLFEKLMSYPTQEEVKAFGKYLFCDDMSEGSLEHVAANLSEQEIHDLRFWNKALKMAGLRKEDDSLRESAWIEGSIVQNGGQVQENLRHAIWYKYLIYTRKALRL